jgi:hypothetical protein
VSCAPAEQERVRHRRRGHVRHHREVGVRRV